ncbi:putative restculine oxidase precursor [Diaporthe ampelina]|uniref:Putative restculine oxidase n=1 Tax=Diaporthe ampelina TaxID=1214573 RepID=A0A0G2FWE8_9PEZI|nr:putative restculine oxidase precursor [Diaporthe ampelina]
MHGIGAPSWTNSLSLSGASGFGLEFTNEWLKPLGAITEGAYASEAGVLEPEWQKTDPTGLFYAHNAVGGQDWRIMANWMVCQRKMDVFAVCRKK